MTKKPRKTEETPASDVAKEATASDVTDDTGEPTVTTTPDAAATDAVPEAETPDRVGGEDGTSSVEAVPDDDAPESDVEPHDEGDPVTDTTDENSLATDLEPAEHLDDRGVAGALPAQGHADVPPTAAAPAATPSSGPGFGALLLGGLIAGAIGFAVAWFMPQDAVAPGPDPALEDRLAALEAEVADVRNTEPVEAFDASGLETRQGDAEARIDALASTLDNDLAALTERLDRIAAEVEELAARPVFEAGDTEAAMNEQVAAFERIVADAGAAARAELDELRQEAEAMRAEAEAMQQEAIAATETADRRATLAAVQAAVDSGAPFEDVLAALDEAPEALAGVAASGVPTLAELRRAFPDAARAALAATETEATAEDSGMSRLTGFLRRQTNARSLAPQEGGSADAILSRAEAALDEGDLDAALTELDALPPDAASAMSSWLDEARARAAAVAAAEELAEG